MGKLKELLAELKLKPWVAHLLRMQDRFANRLGNQFAGAITYFSVLALVPVLMFAFAALGFTLTVLRPDMLQQVEETITARLGGMGPELGDQIGGLIRDFLQNWQAVGIVGLLSAIYSASGWAGNLKRALRALTRPDFDMTEARPNFVLEKLVNLVLLLGLLVLIPVTFALASLSTTLTGWFVGVTGLEGVPGVATGLHLVGPIGSAVAGWALFMYVLTVFPERKFPFRDKAWAAVIGSVGLGLLQYLASFLIGSFLGNPAAALFGPVIVLMLFLNLFARLILYVAAWMATAIQQANPVQLQDIDEPLVEVEASPVTAADVEAAEAQRQAAQLAAEAEDDEHRTIGERLRVASGLPIGGEFHKEQHRADFDRATPDAASAPDVPETVGEADRHGTDRDREPVGARAAAAGPTRGGSTTAPEGAPPLVSRDSAVRNARATMQVGWVTGAVAGIGIGAVLAAVTGFATRFMGGGRDRGVSLEERRRDVRVPFQRSHPEKARGAVRNRRTAPRASTGLRAKRVSGRAAHSTSASAGRSGATSR